MTIVLNMVSHDDLFLLRIKKTIEISTRGTNSMLFLNLPKGSFAVQIGDHLRFGITCGPIWRSISVWTDHLRCCTSLFVVAAEKVRRNVENSENSISDISITLSLTINYTCTSRNHKSKGSNRQWVSRNICLVSRKA